MILYLSIELLYRIEEHSSSLIYLGALFTFRQEVGSGCVVLGWAWPSEEESGRHYVYICSAMMVTLLAADAEYTCFN